MTSPTPSENWNEQERLCVLQSYGILDTAPEPLFDDIVDLARRICDAPIALISLVDENRQWFKAQVGLEARETARTLSFCDHAMREDEVMVVRDATVDPRFGDNDLVTGDLGIRFYAGAPLVTPDGVPLGSLCVIDHKPRPEGLTDLQTQTLRVLARQAISLMELRRAVDQRDESEARFRVIADSMPQMVWSTLPDGFHDYFNARWYQFTGVEEGSTHGEGWNAIFHPDDQLRAREIWASSLASGDLYEIEYRLRRNDGVYRWTLGRAVPMRNEAGEIVRWFGTCTDIDDLKRMEQSHDLVSQELSHRIKNIFAVVSALIALSAREYPESRPFSRVVRERIGALARAHEFVRPHSTVSQPLFSDMTLHAFLAALFRPYAAEDGSPRVVLEGDDVHFDDQAATSVALLFHELATNAAKYGALSAVEGRVTLNTRREGERFVLEWIENGGPAIDGPPRRSGFGSSLATLSVEGQLGGRLERVWEDSGLRVRADLPATALSRRLAALATST